MISIVAASGMSVSVRNGASGSAAPDSRASDPSKTPLLSNTPPPSGTPDVAQENAAQVTGTGKPVEATILLALQEAQDAEKKNRDGLTKEEVEVVAELKKDDASIRRHERAHASAAGPYGGMPQFEFVQGPDGKQYVVSGEVKIDASPGKDAAATIQKMEVIIRAALAPADPSPQDRAVAAQAKQLLAKAQASVQEEKMNEQTGKTDFLFKSKGLSLASVLDAYAQSAKALTTPTNHDAYGLSA